MSLLRIDDMANNTVFALEYLLLGNSGKFREQIKDGIELCSMIEKGEHIDDIISYNELEIWEFMQLMKRFFRPEELSEITKEAKEIKLRLNNSLSVHYVADFFSIKEIRNMQHFFNHVGHPFLRDAISKFKRM